MDVDQMHFEDVKAGLRKRFLTIRTFEIEAGLPKGSVHDHFRGRRSARVKDAIEEALAQPAPSHLSEYSNGDQPSHRLNAGAK